MASTASTVLAQSREASGRVPQVSTFIFSIPLLCDRVCVHQSQHIRFQVAVAECQPESCTMGKSRVCSTTAAHMPHAKRNARKAISKWCRAVPRAHCRLRSRHPCCLQQHPSKALVYTFLEVMPHMEALEQHPNHTSLAVSLRVGQHLPGLLQVCPHSNATPKALSSEQQRIWANAQAAIG